MKANVFVYGFVAFSTKISNRSEPVVQQQGFSERKIRRNELYTLLCFRYLITTSQLKFSFSNNTNNIVIWSKSSWYKKFKILLSFCNKASLLIYNF